MEKIEATGRLSPRNEDNMNGNVAGPWTVVRPLLIQRSGALLDAVECCRDSVKPPEHVHKLRIATRRLQAALDSFAELLTEKSQRRLKKRVQQLRRSAGRIRDLDVLIPRLQKSGAGAGKKSVIAVLKDQRRRLARDLRKHLSRQEQDRLRRELKRCARGRERADESTTDLVAWTAEQMQPVVDRFLAAAHDDLHKIENLHRLRRRGKQLRYSLELFRDHLDPDSVTRLLKSLRRFQERLGDMNDHATARLLLSEVAESADDRRVREAAAKMAAREKRLLKRNRRRFLAWWQKGAADRIGSRIQECVFMDVEATVVQ